MTKLEILQADYNTLSRTVVLLNYHSHSLLFKKNNTSVYKITNERKKIRFNILYPKKS